MPRRKFFGPHLPRKEQTWSNFCPIGCGGYHSKKHKAYRALRAKNKKRILNSGFQTLATRWRGRRAAAAAQNQANNDIDNIFAAVPPILNRLPRRRGRRMALRA